MVHCRNCKFWSTPSDEVQSKSGYRPCQHPKFIYGTSGDYADEVDADSFYYADSEGYNAFIESGPDFGCIHGEKQE